MNGVGSTTSIKSYSMRKETILDTKGIASQLLLTQAKRCEEVVTLMTDKKNCNNYNKRIFYKIIQMIEKKIEKLKKSIGVKMVKEN